MELAAITPKYLMQTARSITTISMYLFHLFDDPRYEMNYRCDPNFKIIDNSVFETRELPSDEHYFFHIEAFAPDEIIAPDVPHDIEQTLEKTLCFIELYASRLRKTKIQAVVQASTLEEGVECYKIFTSNQHISTISFPYRMKLQGNLGRKDLICHLWDEGLLSQKDHHLLGLCSIQELIDLNKLDCIRSCDSSIFYRHAQEGVVYSDNIPSTRTDIPIDFDAQDEGCKDIFIRNIECLRQVLR